MTREWQEASNEYLKVRISFSFAPHTFIGFLTANGKYFNREKAQSPLLGMLPRVTRARVWSRASKQPKIVIGGMLDVLEAPVNLGRTSKQDFP